MTKEMDKDVSVSSASTDLDMEEVKKRREEIRQGLEKLHALSERSRAISKEIAKTTRPLREALEKMESQLEPQFQALRRLDDFGFGGGRPTYEVPGLLDDALDRKEAEKGEAGSISKTTYTSEE